MRGSPGSFWYSRPKSIIVVNLKEMWSVYSVWGILTGPWLVVLRLSEHASSKTCQKLWDVMKIMKPKPCPKTIRQPVVSLLLGSLSGQGAKCWSSRGAMVGHRDRYNDEFCIGQRNDANMSKNCTNYTPITFEHKIPVWKKDLIFMVSSLAAFIVYQFPAPVSPQKSNVFVDCRFQDVPGWIAISW